VLRTAGPHGAERGLIDPAALDPSGSTTRPRPRATRPVLPCREHDVGHVARAVSRSIPLWLDQLCFFARQLGLGTAQDLPARYPGSQAASLPRQSPLTLTIWRRVWRISTRSAASRMITSTSLYAPGISSRNASVRRHSMPCMADSS